MASPRRATIQNRSAICAIPVEAGAAEEQAADTSKELNITPVRKLSRREARIDAA